MLETKYLKKTKLHLKIEKLINRKCKDQASLDFACKILLLAKIHIWVFFQFIHKKDNTCMPVNELK